MNFKKLHSEYTMPLYYAQNAHKYFSIKVYYIKLVCTKHSKGAVVFDVKMLLQEGHI